MEKRSPANYMSQEILTPEQELAELRQEYENFSYMISHDLSAGFRGIQTVASWFKEDYADALDEDGLELLNILGSRVTRLQDMLTVILEFSRIGRLNSPSDSIDLNLLIPSVISELSRNQTVLWKQEAPAGKLTAETANPLSKNNDIVNWCVDPLPSIWAGEARMIQLFTHIIRNALEMQNKSTGEILISAQESAAGSQITVRDNGAGIPQDKADKIFDLFFTTDPNAENRKLGMGLTLAKKIANRYHGRIEVESQVNEFTAVTVFIPAQQ